MASVSMMKKSYAPKTKIINIARNCTIVCLGLFAMSSCATQNADDFDGWAANGYLKPMPDQNPILIGIFDNRKECNEAADGWASQQVVGNPVFTECLRISTD